MHRRRFPVHHFRRRPRVEPTSGLLAFAVVLGPGLLAGLSDDDPAGITTYSILGARYGYQLLWVLAISTAALIVFHELAARMGVVTGKGLMALVRERHGQPSPDPPISACISRAHAAHLRRSTGGPGPWQGDGLRTSSGTLP